MPMRPRPNFPRGRSAVRLWLSLGLCALTLFACAPARAAQPGLDRGVLEIGADLPLSQGPTFGASIVDGMDFALQQQGSVDGYSIRLVALDDTVNGLADPSKGVLDVYQLAASPALVAMVGGVDSALARVQITASNPDRLALVSLSAGAECLTQDQSYCLTQDGYTPSALRPANQNNFFRTSAPQTLQGPAMADWAVSNLHLTRVAVWNDGEPYGQTMALGFASEFQRRGGEVIQSASFNPANPGFATLAQSAHAQGAQAVYVGAVGDSACGAAASGWSGAYWMIPQAIADAACLAAAGPGASRLLASAGYADPAALRASASLVAGFKRRYPDATDLGPLTFDAYDATRLILAAIARAASASRGQAPTRQAVLAQLAATHGFRSLTGPMTFDAEGDLTEPVVQIDGAGGSARHLTWVYRGESRLPVGL